MDEAQAQQILIKNTAKQSLKIDEISEKMNLVISGIKELVATQKELLTFFVALDRREMGLNDVNSQEYLTELRKDEFKPITD